MLCPRKLVHLPLRDHLLQPQQVLDDSHRVPNLGVAQQQQGRGSSAPRFPQLPPTAAQDCRDRDSPYVSGSQHLLFLDIFHSLGQHDGGVAVLQQLLLQGQARGGMARHSPPPLLPQGQPWHPLYPHVSVAQVRPRAQQDQVTHGPAQQCRCYLRHAVVPTWGMTL